MATTIKVMGSNPGFSGRWRAGSRHWANGVAHVLEVIDDPTDGPPLKEDQPIDPTTGLSSMTHISKAGLAALEADKGYINVLRGDDAVVEQLSAKAGVLEFENAALKVRVAELEAALSAAKATAEATKAIVSDEAKVEGDAKPKSDPKTKGGK